MMERTEPKDAPARSLAMRQEWEQRDDDARDRRAGIWNKAHQHDTPKRKAKRKAAKQARRRNRGKA